MTFCCSSMVSPFVELTEFAEADGRVDKYQLTDPKFYVLVFTLTDRFENELELVLLLDGVRKVFKRQRPANELHAINDTVADLTVQELESILNARVVEGRIKDQEFTLTDDNKCALREFAKAGPVLGNVT